MKITGCEHLTDFNRILRAAVKRGPVLVCYLDGLGWYVYEKAVKADAIPYVRENFWMSSMETVFPPLTNPAMATMLTGVLPETHGVVSRKQHRSQVPTIFAELPEAVIVEGDSIILQTEVLQRLHTKEEDGNMDYSIYQDALDAVEAVPPLLFVHFHGIDDAGHSFGPYAPEAMEKIKEIDAYIQELTGRWPGEVFLISDHGLHEQQREGQDSKMAAAGNGGDHGLDISEDRTIIFGWHDKRQTDFPDVVDVKFLEEMMGSDHAVTQMVFTGRDEYAAACSGAELMKPGNVRLLRQKGEYNRGTAFSEDTWRLSVASEPIARRWCKDVVQVDIRRKKS